MTQRTDTERLDFVLKKRAWIQWVRLPKGTTGYHLMVQDEDEVIHTLSGPHCRESARAAIDAAMDLKDENGSWT